jgi:UDP-N-acetylmuramyl pentapeptide phosphotransferase/UDP-N-acetylglucosamine-1-phosphate transferase
MRYVTGALAGAGLMLVALACVPERLRRRLVMTNYRGAAVPAVLGPALAMATIGTAALLRLGWEAVDTPFVPVPWLFVLAGAVVVGACLLDDLAPARGPRGMRQHAAALSRGSVTTGIVKLAGLTAAGILVGLVASGSVLDVVLRTVVVAGAANLWNGLDVAPGRAVKWFLPAMAVAMVGLPTVPFAVSLGAALVALRVDLVERAMLGDSGSNLLGFLLGAALVLQLSTWGLVLAAAALIALNLLAETVTLSRIIEAAPPLRWIDRAGRRPPRVPGRPDSSTGTRSSPP